MSLTPPTPTLALLLALAASGCFNPSGDSGTSSTDPPGTTSPSTGTIDPTTDDPTTTSTTPPTTGDPTTAPDTTATSQVTTTTSTTPPDETTITTTTDLTSTGPDTTSLPGQDCGNGTLDPGEQCEDGNVEDGDGCSAACLRDALFVFLTSKPYTVGQFDQISGADTLCSELGQSIPFIQTPQPKVFHAFLSDVVDAAATDVGTNKPYIRPDRVTVAANALDLLGPGDLAAAIIIDENASKVPVQGVACSDDGPNVWTGSTPSGLSTGITCSNWKTELPGTQGTVGNANQQGDAWADTQTPCPCDSALHLYCFELPA